MPEGPFGGPRPFVDANFLIVIGFEEDQNVMDKLVMFHKNNETGESFEKVLNKIELEIFNRIIDLDDNINPNVVGVRVVDQLEIRLDTDSISMDLLVQIAATGRDAINDLLDEAPNTVLRIE